MAWITEKGSALYPLFQLVRLGVRGHHRATKRQTSRLSGCSSCPSPNHSTAYVASFDTPADAYEIRRLAGGTDGPGQLPCGHRQRVDEDARAVADVLMFTANASGSGGFRGGFALKHLHTGFFIAANHQAYVLVDSSAFAYSWQMVWALGSKCASWLFSQYSLLGASDRRLAGYARCSSG